MRVPDVRTRTAGEVLNKLQQRLPHSRELVNVEVSVNEIGFPAALLNEELVLSRDPGSDLRRVKLSTQRLGEERLERGERLRGLGQRRQGRKWQTFVREAEVQAEVDFWLMRLQRIKGLRCAALQSHHAGNCAKLPATGEFADGTVNVVPQPVIVGANNHDTPGRRRGVIRWLRPATARAWPFLKLMVEVVRPAVYIWALARACLFVVNGLGLGNSTRCCAVIEHLAAAGGEVHVLTGGNGLAFFKDKDCVHSVTAADCLYYSGNDGAVSGWSTLKSLRSLMAIAKVKRTQLAGLLQRIRPDVAVVDSEYAISPLRRLGIPVIGLNTSEMVVTEFLKRRYLAAGTHSQFWFVEFADYLFHKHFCDLVLSPFPLRTPTRHRKFRRIGLIARHAITERAPRTGPQPFPSPRQLRTVVFMLSGSVHASDICFDHHEIPFKIEVVGRSGQSRGNVTYHGRQHDNADLLARADALVINAGYSAVSEAFVLRKPVFVVPVPGHAEQFVNACLVKDLGLGFMATEHDVLDQLLNMYRQDRWLGLKPMPVNFEIEGAREAAAVILSTANRAAAAMLTPGVLAKA